MERLSLLDAVWKARLEANQPGPNNGIVRYTQPIPEDPEQKPRIVGEEYTHWVEVSIPRDYIRRWSSNGVWQHHSDKGNSLILTIENTCWIFLEAYGDPKYPPNGSEFAREFSSRNKGLSLLDAKFLVFNIDRIDRELARRYGYGAARGSAAFFKVPGRSQYTTGKPIIGLLTFTFNGKIPYADIYESLAPTRPKPLPLPAKPHVPDALERLRALKVGWKAEEVAKAKTSLANNSSSGFSGSSPSKSNTTSQETKLLKNLAVTSISSSPPQKSYPFIATGATLSELDATGRETKVADKIIAAHATTLPLNSRSIVSGTRDIAAQNMEVTSQVAADNEVLNVERMVRALSRNSREELFEKIEDLYIKPNSRQVKDKSNGTCFSGKANTQERQTGAVNSKRKGDPERQSNKLGVVSSIRDLSLATDQKSSSRISEAHGNEESHAEGKRQKFAASSTNTQKTTLSAPPPRSMTPLRKSTFSTFRSARHDPEMSSAGLSFEEQYSDPLFWSTGKFSEFTPQERRDLYGCV